MITPVLLCGGYGTRLWPLSRKSYPKQFVTLLGTETLFQSSAKRLSGHGFAAPLVITNSDFRFIAAKQLDDAEIEPCAILIEPEARNTGPAVLAAALWLAQTDPDGLMLIAPTDHIVHDAAAFHAAVEIGRSAAEAGKLVTFGVTPHHPETGYGYLELAERPDAAMPCVIDLVRFVEKPDASRAAEMVASERYLWNAGVLLCSARGILDAFRSHAPELVAPVRTSIKAGAPDLGFFRLDPDAWHGVESISLDYAVMERADNLVVVPISAGWSDLGGWDAVLRESIPDADGVATFGPATAIDCGNSLLRSEDDRLEIVGLGLKNIIAIAMPDAVLVADMSRAQDVKSVVEALRVKKIRQAETASRDYRPWGWYECLVVSDRFQVKRIVVVPGGVLSLQTHNHRAEHWIVVAGTAHVTIGDDHHLVTENQSVYIPLGSKHRLENQGKVPMTLIEVQTGSYFGEDDIKRYEDAYARN